MNARYIGAAVLVGLAAIAVLAPACFTQAPAELPPRIIECSPKPLATNVDANLKEISVTFDRPMKAGERSGFASIRFAGAFPAERDAVPSWDPTGTICRLPVHLEPDVTYAVAVNPAKQRTFTDTAGAAALGFAWVFATGERSPDEFSPHVVRTDPPLGAADVDPATRAIKITFSRPVAPGDYSWARMRGSGQYPNSGGVQLSDDRLTTTLNVSLNPGTVYALGVNDVGYFGYKDTRGRPVLPFGLCFRTRQ